MKIEFYKYQGTGNDFVMIDNRTGQVAHNVEMVQHFCDRRFGIGADGLILIEEHPELDFTMVYYNSDGSQSFCGNGSRCAVAFSQHLGIIENKAHFEAIDGAHEATIENGWVSLKMLDVATIEVGEAHYFIDTGSPHYIQYVADVAAVDVYEQGRQVRYSDRFKAEGTNVNFIEVLNDGISVRTYERGVEDETLSCGTGVTAAAISAHHKGLVKNDVCPIVTKGGKLSIKLTKNGVGYTNIWLQGPADMVFKGSIDG